MSDEVVPRGRIGRRSILTPARQQALTLALRNGATRRLACTYAGMNETSFYRLLARNRAFREAVLEAEAHHEMAMVGRIKASANSGDWKAAAFWLERRRYDEWGPADVRAQVPVNVEVRSGVAAAIADGGTDLSSLGASQRLTQLAAAFDLVVRVGGVPLSVGGGSMAPPVRGALPTEVDPLDTA
jgi:hypothetical protein